MPSWTYFGHPAYRYRNEKGQWASDVKVRNWGHTSISENANAVKTLANSLTSGSLTVGQWEQQMRDAIKAEYIAQYLLGKGGRDNMTSEDWGSIGGMLADQYRYLDNFAIEIAAGNLSEAQIAMRSAMYIRSSREAFERATARVRGIPDMPAFPGDGNTRCLTNCRCYWAYRKRGNTWECTWNLTAGENCDDCIDNANKWDPLVLQIGEKAGHFVTIDERPVFIGGPGAGAGGGGVANIQARGVLATGENELYRWSNLQEIYDLSRGKRKSSLDTTSAQDFYFAPPSTLSKDTWPSRTYGRMILDRAILKDAGWKEDPQLTTESAWRLFGKEARAQSATDTISAYLNSIQGFEIDKLPQGVTLQDITGWLKYRLGRDIPVVIQGSDWAGKAA